MKSRSARWNGQANNSSTFSKQVGLSLVELLIATAIGLVIVAALTQLFADVSRSNREMVKTNSQIENARFAMHLLRDDIVHAGYWGGFIPQFDDYMHGGPPNDTPVDDAANPDYPFSPCVTFASWNADYVNSLIGVPLLVYSTAPLDCGAIVVDKAPSTDILVVRHAETCAAGDANCDAVVAGRLYFQTTNCASELSLPLPRIVDTSGHTFNEMDCTTLAARRKVVQHIYYVRTWANSAGDGVPTLVRSEFDLMGGGLAQQPPVPLVQGIERFRVELGIDEENAVGDPITDDPAVLTVLEAYQEAVKWEDPLDRRLPLNRGDGVPERFIHCSGASGCELEDLLGVVSVRLYLLARSDEPSPGYTDSKVYTLGSLSVPAFNDEFKRHAFSSTVRLNNVAGRREAP